MFCKLKRKLDKNIGKTIIKFECSGCMAHIHEFEFIGTIVDRSKPIKGVHCNNNFNYKVRVEKNNTGYELRNNPDKPIYENVPAWYIQKLEGDYLVIYD